MLAKLMKMLMQNAGAQKGYLLLERSREWTIAAAISLDSETLPAAMAVNFQDRETSSDIFPDEIVNYVARTQENVVLCNAVKEGAFTRDRYIISHQLKSVACIPIKNEGKLLGILYLENNSTTQAFNPDRLSWIELFCFQTAINLERIYLSEQLANHFRDLEVELEKKNQELNREVAERQLLERKLISSENKMRAVFEAMTDIILIIDLDRNIDIIPTNSTACELQANIVDYTVEKFFHSETAEIWCRQIQQALKEQKTINFDYQISTENQELWFAARISPMSNNSAIWVAQNITDRKLAESALRLSEEKFSKAFRCNPSAMTITLLADGRHIEVNDTFCHLTGYTADEIINRTAVDLNLWVSLEDRHRLFHTLSNEGVFRNYEFQFRTKSGDIKTALLSAEIVNIRGQDCLLSLSNDITDRQKAESALRQKNEELARTIQELKLTQEELIQSEKMAALGQLIAGVAHEINTPLGAIRASISNISAAIDNTIRQLPQLLQQLSPPQQADFLALIETARHKKQQISFREERQFKRALKQELASYNLENSEEIATTLVRMGITTDIESFVPLLQDKNYSAILEAAYNLLLQENNSQNIILAIERASKIVFALKSYARHDDSGKMTMASITNGIDIVLTIYQNQLKQGIEVAKNYGEVPDILCYPEELNQVWTNLIHNAIQAMNNKGKLDIEVAEKNDRVVVQIVDSGSGIPPAVKAKIFEPFFTTKPTGEGSGLGLHIVRKIIDKHRGKIEVESEPGRTAFTVWLPIQSDA